MNQLIAKVEFGEGVIEGLFEIGIDAEKEVRRGIVKARINELIAKLYDQAIVIEDGGDYVCGELDLAKFAKLIVQECANWMNNEQDEQGDRIGDNFYWSDRMTKHFGVE